MNRILIIIFLSLIYVSVQAQLITFDALKNGVIDDAEIKKELILNGFTKVTDASDSSTDTYAFAYDEEDKKASIWVSVKALYQNGSQGLNSKLYTIEIRSIGPFSQEYLKKEIVEHCTFEKIGNDDALMYNYLSIVIFRISSENGTNYISVSPSLETLNSTLETEELERKWQEKLRMQGIEQERFEQERVERERREEEERIEREKQAQAERLNLQGKNAFGNKGVGEAYGSQGITEGEGNQGDPNGSPDADNYGTGGGLGDGPTFGGLGSRKAVGSLPMPNMSGCEITQKMVVTVEIVVGQNGKVESAIVQSASYQDNCIWTGVVEAAKQSRFSKDRNANLKQTGWIKYTIVP